MTKNVGDESRIIALYAIALLAASRGREPRAARLRGFLEAKSSKMSDGDVFDGPVHRRSHALLVEMLENALEPEDLERLAAEGRSMSVDMAVAEGSLV
jgi:hypothetical protein